MTEKRVFDGKSGITILKWVSCVWRISHSFYLRNNLQEFWMSSSLLRFVLYCLLHGKKKNLLLYMYVHSCDMWHIKITIHACLAPAPFKCHLFTSPGQRCVRLRCQHLLPSHISIFLSQKSLEQMEPNLADM